MKRKRILDARCCSSPLRRDTHGKVRRIFVASTSDWEKSFPRRRQRRQHRLLPDSPEERCERKEEKRNKLFGRTPFWSEIVYATMMAETLSLSNGNRAAGPFSRPNAKEQNSSKHTKQVYINKMRLFRFQRNEFRFTDVIIHLAKSLCISRPAEMVVLHAQSPCDSHNSRTSRNTHARTPTRLDLESGRHERYSPKFHRKQREKELFTIVGQRACGQPQISILHYSFSFVVFFCSRSYCWRRSWSWLFWLSSVIFFRMRVCL